MTLEPLVTVIIPTYNRADKVGDAIESALNQSYKNIQIIVIDDGSEDHTSHLMALYPQVDYILQNHAGQAAARNNGLKNARGSIIANLDSDDLWDPEFLSHCVRKLELDSLDFVFANWTQENKYGKDHDFLIGDPFLQPFFKRTKNGWINLDNNDLRNLYLNACPSPSSSVVLRKSSIVKGWDQGISIGDDWALYLDMILSKECKVAFTLQKLWKKRIDDINIYDGRARSEVLRLLYINDINRVIESHASKLTEEEMKILEHTQMLSLVELSKHKMIREFDFLQSLRLFKRSCSISMLFSLKAIPIVIFRGFLNKIKRFFLKKEHYNYGSSPIPEEITI